MRAEVIERLMCEFSVDYGEIARRHGFTLETLGDAKAKLAPMLEASLATRTGTRVTVPTRHRLFLRTVASAFDAYFAAVPNRHAKAV
jgi:oxygen-independent coproporphyrinogen-3 oxidase